MWTSTESAAAHLGRALHQRARGRTIPPDRLGESLAALEAATEGEEVLISRYLAPYKNPTLRRYYSVMIRWWDWCIHAKLHLLAARRDHIEQWARHLATQGLRPSTIGGQLNVVCGFYRWAHQNGLTTTDAGAHVRRPRRGRRSRLRWLDVDQARSLLAASRQLGPPWDGLFHLLTLNGLRLGETLAARIEHLSTSDGHTTLHLPSRKGDVMDTLTLPVASASVLAGCIGNRRKGRILMERGRVLTPARVYRVCDQISDACGLDFPVRPHMLRATFVTLSLDAGVPARDVMASSGHAHVEMVAYYDRAHAAIRRNAAPRLAAYLDV